MPPKAKASAAEPRPPASPPPPLPNLEVHIADLVNACVEGAACQGEAAAEGGSEDADSGPPSSDGAPPAVFPVVSMESDDEEESKMVHEMVIAGRDMLGLEGELILQCSTARAQSSVLIVCALFSLQIHAHV